MGATAPTSPMSYSDVVELDNIGFVYVACRNAGHVYAVRNNKFPAVRILETILLRFIKSKLTCNLKKYMLRTDFYFWVESFAFREKGRET